MEGPL